MDCSARRSQAAPRCDWVRHLGLPAIGRRVNSCGEPRPRSAGLLARTCPYSYWQTSSTETAGLVLRPCPADAPFLPTASDDSFFLASDPSPAAFPGSTGGCSDSTGAGAAAAGSDFFLEARIASLVIRRISL